MQASVIITSNVDDPERTTSEEIAVGAIAQIAVDVYSGMDVDHVIGQAISHFRHNVRMALDILEAPSHAK